MAVRPLNEVCPRTGSGGVVYCHVKNRRYLCSESVAWDLGRGALDGRPFLWRLAGAAARRPSRRGGLSVCVLGGDGPYAGAVAGRVGWFGQRRALGEVGAAVVGRGSWRCPRLLQGRDTLAR